MDEWICANMWCKIPEVNDVFALLPKLSASHARFQFESTRFDEQKKMLRNNRKSCHQELVFLAQIIIVIFALHFFFHYIGHLLMCSIRIDRNRNCFYYLNQSSQSSSNVDRLISISLSNVHNIYLHPIQIYWINVWNGISSAKFGGDEEQCSIRMNACI